MPPNFGFCEHQILRVAEHAKDTSTLYLEDLEGVVCGLVTPHRYDVGYRCVDHRPLVLPGVVHNIRSNRKQRRMQVAKARR